MDSMYECIGTRGTVVGIDEDLDVVVSYPSGNRYENLMAKTLRRALKMFVIILGSCRKRQKPQAQRRARQSVTAKRGKSKTPKFITAIQT